MRSDETWGWQDLRDYVVAQIEARGGAVVRDPKKEAAIFKFVRKIPGERLSPAEGPGTLCGVFVETDDKTGLAVSIAPLRLGGKLAESWPV